MNPSSDFKRLEEQSSIRILGIFAALLSHSSIFNSLNGILIPVFIDLYFDGNSRALGFITGIGSIVQMSGVVSSLLSDRVEFRTGRRRPFIFAATVLSCLGIFSLLIVEFLDSASLLTNRIFILAGYYIAMCGLSITSPITTAFLVDLIPESQRGMGSGVVSLYAVLGSAAGFALFVLDLTMTKVFIIYIVLTIAANTSTLLNAQETQYKRTADQELSITSILTHLKFDPKKHFNFIRICLVRLIFYIALGVQSYIQFFLRDMIGVTDAPTSMAVLALCMLGFGIFISIPAGKLCDKHSKQLFMGIGISSLGIAVILMMFASQFWHMIIVVCFFSTGQIVYGTAESALACSILPSQRQSGSYLSILSLLNMVGLSLGSVVLGNVLSFFPDGVPIKDLPQQYTRQGYVFTWGVAVLFLLLSIVVLSGMKIVSKPKVLDVNILESEDDEIPLVL
ncbi:hypothetical protein GEMRC1_010731 [Eukaryota sp. GEM-RC1]